MVPDQTPADEPVASHVRTDRQPVGRSVAVTPETLYLTTIAVQQARIAELQADLDQTERELQHVIDRYEAVLDGTAPQGEPVTDGGTASISTDRDAADVRQRLISLLEGIL